MKTARMISILSLAVFGIPALASEATQFNPPPARVARPAVSQPVLPRAVVVSDDEATVFVDVPQASAVPREPIRAQALEAARTHRFSDLYIGG